MLIEIICLFAKSYLDANQFEELFLNNITKFESILDDRTYINIVSINWTSNSEIISLKNYLCKYLFENFFKAL